MFVSQRKPVSHITSVDQTSADLFPIKKHVDNIRDKR
jgi:hypothetical protein